MRVKLTRDTELSMAKRGMIFSAELRERDGEKTYWIRYPGGAVAIKPYACVEIGENGEELTHDPTDVEKLTSALRGECADCSDRLSCKQGVNAAGLYCPNKDAADRLEELAALAREGQNAMDENRRIKRDAASLQEAYTRLATERLEAMDWRKAEQAAEVEE